MLHPGGSDAGLTSGLLHPVFGLDHLLAMVSVGVVSSQLGGKNIWRVPLTFVLAMGFGGALGVGQIPLPLAEYGIAVSVVFLGAGITVANKETSARLITACVMFFGAFHGHAHGVEIPQSVSPLLYTLGFLISTATLHIFGVVIGEVATMKGFLLRGLRVVGVAVAAAGVFFLLKSIGIIA